MSANAILDRLREHNPGVIGCIATRGDVGVHNFRQPYEFVDAMAVGEEAAQMFELMDALPAEAERFDELFLEMKAHSIFVHRLDDGVLVVVNEAVDRRVFRRLKVGVNLFVRPLKRALAEAEAPRASPPPAAEAPEPEAPQTKDRPRPKRYYRGVEY